MIEPERLRRRALAGDKGAALRLADLIRPSKPFGGTFDTPIGEAEVSVAAVGDPDDPVEPGRSPLEMGLRVHVARVSADPRRYVLDHVRRIAWDVRLSRGREFDVPWLEIDTVDRGTDAHGRDWGGFHRLHALFVSDVLPALEHWLARNGGIAEFERHLLLEGVRRAEIEREKARERYEQAESKVAEAIVGWLRAGGRA